MAKRPSSPISRGTFCQLAALDKGPTIPMSGSVPKQVSIPEIRCGGMIVSLLSVMT